MKFGYTKDFSDGRVYQTQNVASSFCSIAPGSSTETPGSSTAAGSASAAVSPSSTCPASKARLL